MSNCEAGRSVLGGVHVKVVGPWDRWVLPAPVTSCNDDGRIPKKFPTWKPM